MNFQKVYSAYTPSQQHLLFPEALQEIFYILFCLIGLHLILLYQQCRELFYIHALFQGLPKNTAAFI